ncbi:hypothetical protein ZIOFF_074103 [Zingiber officinale]|uniref:Uncharacterized protein n=1 Tax=Zingiber officinale TaxID=94328 RepID=A0A8J5BZL6_ZINOF|nr:hypothetical protein ZIOFF_074103 [Zingiber officinale]
MKAISTSSAGFGPGGVFGPGVVQRSGTPQIGGGKRATEKGWGNAWTNFTRVRIHNMQLKWDIELWKMINQMGSGNRRRPLPRPCTRTWASVANHASPSLPLALPSSSTTSHLRAVAYRLLPHGDSLSSFARDASATDVVDHAAGDGICSSSLAFDAQPLFGG